MDKVTQLHKERSELESIVIYQRSIQHYNASSHVHNLKRQIMTLTKELEMSIVKEEKIKQKIEENLKGIEKSREKYEKYLQTLSPIEKKAVEAYQEFEYLIKYFATENRESERETPYDHLDISVTIEELDQLALIARNYNIEDSLLEDHQFYLRFYQRFVELKKTYLAIN